MIKAIIVYIVCTLLVACGIITVGKLTKIQLYTVGKAFLAAATFSLISLSIVLVVVEIF